MILFTLPFLKEWFRLIIKMLLFIMLINVANILLLLFLRLFHFSFFFVLFVFFVFFVFFFSFSVCPFKLFSLPFFITYLFSLKFFLYLLFFLWEDYVVVMLYVNFIVYFSKRMMWIYP